MYREHKYYVKYENGWNKIHIGDPHLFCRPETPSPGGPFSAWKGPFDTPEQAADAVNHERVHRCRGCFNPSVSPEQYRRSREVLTPTGGKSAYRRK